MGSLLFLFCICLFILLLLKLAVQCFETFVNGLLKRVAGLLCKEFGTHTRNTNCGFLVQVGLGFNKRHTNIHFGGRSQQFLVTTGFSSQCVAPNGLQSQN